MLFDAVHPTYPLWICTKRRTPTLRNSKDSRARVFFDIQPLNPSIALIDLSLKVALFDGTTWLSDVAVGTGERSRSSISTAYELWPFHPCAPPSASGRWPRPAWSSGHCRSEFGPLGCRRPGGICRYGQIANHQRPEEAGKEFMSRLLGKRNCPIPDKAHACNALVRFARRHAEQKQFDLPSREYPGIRKRK